jgi:hypothetical protein
MKTAVERSMDHQAKLAAQGYRRMSVWLSPVEAENLDLMASKNEVSRVQLLRDALGYYVEQFA